MKKSKYNTNTHIFHAKKKTLLRVPKANGDYMLFCYFSDSMKKCLKTTKKYCSLF